MVNKAYQESIALTLDKLREQLNENRQRQVKKLDLSISKRINLSKF